MITLVALDIAGTTLDEGGTVYRVLGEAVNDAGSGAGADDVRRWMGADKREAIRELLGVGNAAEPEDDLVERVFTDFNERLGAAYRAAPPMPFDGVPAALAHLRGAGIAVALTTGFDRAITDPLLAAVGWDAALIDTVVCTDDVPAGRPAPYLIFRAMERLGVRDVAGVLSAGDTVLDLQAGSNAGAAYVVGVFTGGVDPVTLGRERHTHLLPSVANIPALLGLT